MAIVLVMFKGNVSRLDNTFHVPLQRDKWYETVLIQF